MKFIKNDLERVCIKSIHKEFIDFERDNLPVNLELVYSYKKSELKEPVAGGIVYIIKFFVSGSSIIIWYFETEQERDFKFEELENKYFN